MKHYDYQRLKDQDGHDEFRVTHVATDSRIATCYCETNAKFIVDVLNFHAAVCHGGATPTRPSADPDWGVVKVAKVTPRKKRGAA